MVRLNSRGIPISVGSNNVTKRKIVLHKRTLPYQEETRLKSKDSRATSPGQLE